MHISIWIKVVLYTGLFWLLTLGFTAQNLSKVITIYQCIMCNIINIIIRINHYKCNLSNE